MKGEHGQFCFLQTDVKVEPNLSTTEVPSSDHVWTKDQTKEKVKVRKGQERSMALQSTPMILNC